MEASPRSSVAQAPAPSFAAALVGALGRAGVREACVSPGSRSTPLALALEAEPRMAIRVHLDERSAGFFALGLARASRRPVALVCTSGTAAANYLPALVEASLTRIPLIVLTADRPPELRDWGAAQTIDQLHLFGRHVRWFAEAPVPDGRPDTQRLARALGARAVAVAAGSPPGPVHLNLPMREPLAPSCLPSPGPEALPSGPREWPGALGPAPEAVAWLAGRVARHPCGVVACGPMDEPDAAEAIAALARAADWPLLADPTSQLRRGPHVDDHMLGHGDLFLGDAAFAERHAPELVLHFGAPPTSKAFHGWLERSAPAHVVHIDPAGGFRDPSHAASDFVRGDAASLCRAVVRRLGRPRTNSAWLDAFVTAERAAAGAVAAVVDVDPTLLAAAAIQTLSGCLPETAILYVSNSMAVRDLDAFLPVAPAPLRVLANRGANGIDGMVSSALGAAATGVPTVLLTGDLALLHDASGLLAASRERLPLTIVVLNDDGGGIFSHLPVARLGDAADFARLFRTPHGQDLGRLCHGIGLSHVRIGSREHLAAALKDSLSRSTPSLLEVVLDADRNLEQHRRVRQAVAAALAGAAP